MIFMFKRLILWFGGGGLMLAAFAFLTDCGSRRETMATRHADSIAVEARKVDALTSRESTEERSREVIILKADTAGELRPVLKVIEKTHNEENEKTVNNMQKTDSAAFSAKNEVITKEIEEKPAEAVKTRFWRNAFFWLLGLAATVVGVVTLWRKTLKPWI